jgi:hypothetical protein
MQYLLYFVVFFKVQGTIKEVFVADVVEARLANRKVFTRRHTQDAKVASTQYKRANGIPSSSNSDINSP